MCVHVATSDLSVLVPDGMNWTSDDQGEAMYAADYTSSAGTVTGTLDVVNGSMVVIGSLPNGLGIPGGTSHDWDGIVFSGVLSCKLSRRVRARGRRVFHIVLWI